MIRRVHTRTAGHVFEQLGRGLCPIAKLNAVNSKLLCQLSFLIFHLSEHARYKLLRMHRLNLIYGAILYYLVPGVVYIIYVFEQG